MCMTCLQEPHIGLHQKSHSIALASKLMSTSCAPLCQDAAAQWPLLAPPPGCCTCSACSRNAYAHSLSPAGQPEVAIAVIDLTPVLRSSPPPQPSAPGLWPNHGHSHCKVLLARCRFLIPRLRLCQMAALLVPRLPGPAPQPAPAVLLLLPIPPADRLPAPTARQALKEQPPTPLPPLPPSSPAGAPPGPGPFAPLPAPLPLPALPPPSL